MKRKTPKADPAAAPAPDRPPDLSGAVAELRRFYPHLDSAAVVLDPGGGMPAVVIPLTRTEPNEYGGSRPYLPACVVPESMRWTFSGHSPI